MSARGARSVGGLSYRVKSLQQPGGVFRPFAVAECSGCGASREIRVPGQSNNPEAVQEKFRAAGWEFDAWNASRNVCPGCVEKRKARRHGESGRKKGEDVVVTLSLSSKARDAAAAVRPMGGALPPDKTELSVEERTRVRDMLGGTFDEKVGQYLEGWSDGRIAKEAGDLPPKLVADLREIAYGPLKSVSELETLRAEMAAMEKRHLEEIAQMRARIEAAATALGVRA